MILWSTHRIAALLSLDVDLGCQSAVGCQAAEMVLLERQLEHSKRLHEYQIEEIKRNLFRLHKLINEKQLENDKLDE